MTGSTPVTVTGPGVGHPRRDHGSSDPKLRSGSCYPDWLLERRRQAERALTTVVARCYLLGISTRRMEKLVDTLGIIRLSKSQTSKMAKELDEHVADFRSRPLDAGSYTFVAAAALVLKVREGGRVVNVHALVATGVNADGPRDPGPAGHFRRRRRRMVGLLPGPDRPRSDGCGPGDLRCPPSPGRGDRSPPCRVRRGSAAGLITRRI